MPPGRLAITGMACRLPGQVKTPEDLWDLCSRGRSAWSETPNDRFNVSAFYHPNPDRPGSFNCKGGHFLEEDVGLFDAPFFQITLQEARSLDPQQRLILECVYEALENAGMPNHVVAKDKIGVFAGASIADYEGNNMKDLWTLPMYNATGTAVPLQSNRISYYFDLRGPSMTVDTACSSSLTAFHQACQSLKAGECSAAIVAGCHLSLIPEYYISMARSRLLSDTGKSFAFDHRGTGFGRGEGAACLVLRTLEAAQAAEDAIRAVIVNSGLNQDGRTLGITMPNPVAQEALIRSVYESACIDPEETGYVEAHGTGTKAGDPLEAGSLHSVFWKGRTLRQPLFLGSVKSNIGHLEGVSGITSVIKTALILERGFVLPNCNFECANEEIPLDEWNVKVPQKLVPWPRGKRYASVNNFGFGGSNAHVVLEASPQTRIRRLKTADPRTRRLYVLSGNDKRAAIQRAKDLEAYLLQHPTIFDGHLLDDLAYTLGQRRSLFPWRLAVSASSEKELTEFLSSDWEPSRALQEPTVAFVFTGQGAQWQGMAKELLAIYPVFQHTMQLVDEVLERLGSRFSIIDELLQENPKMSKISEAYMSQPACTAIQLALTDLFASWGINPVAVTGHSSGEIAAAYAAKILTLEESVRIAYARGIAASILVNDARFQGAMLAVGASADEVQPFLDTLSSKRTDIACINSGSSITLSGDENQVLELQHALDKEGFFTRRLPVDVAYHSHHMQYVRHDYQALIGRIEPRSSSISFYSAVQGRKVLATHLHSSYWVDNMVSRVNFVHALESLLLENSKISTLIEVGPHCALRTPVKETIRQQGMDAQVQYLPSLKREVDAVETLQQAACELFVRGLPLDLEGVNFPGPEQTMPKLLTNLPRYPWDHSQRYWHSSRISNNLYHRTLSRNDLLGSLCPESDDFEPRWRNILRVGDHPWIRQHQIQGDNVYPMTGFLAMAMEAIKQEADLHHVSLQRIDIRDVFITHMLTVPDSTAVETMLTLRPCSSERPSRSFGGWYEFSICSWAESRGWDRHCHGSVQGQEAKDPSEIDEHRRSAVTSGASLQINEARRACTEPADTDRFYNSIKSSGVNYGPLFKRLSNILIGEGQQAMATVSVPDTKACMPFDYETASIIHPVILDNCIQMEWVSRGYTRAAPNVTYMPTQVKHVSVSMNRPIYVGTLLQLYSRRLQTLSSNHPLRNRILVTLPEDSETAAIEIDSIVLIPVPNDLNRSPAVQKGLCYRIQLEPCFDFLSADDHGARSQTDTPKIDGVRRMHTLDQTAKRYMRGMLQLVSEQELCYFQSHHQKFYRWAQKLCGAGSPDETALDQDIPQTRGMNAAGRMTCEVGEVLPQILRGNIEALTPMLEDDLLSRYYQEVDSLRETYAHASVCINQMAHQHPQMTIIEICAGTGGATEPILQSLGGGSSGSVPRFANYTYTDISPAFFEKVKSRFDAWGNLLTYNTLDISSDPASQGYQLHSYDLVVACNVLHATPDIHQTMANARALLKPGGKLLLIEETVFKLRHFPFALLPGWWLSQEAYRVDGPLLDLDSWDRTMRATGFSGLDLRVHDFQDENIQCGCLMVTTARETNASEPKTQVVIINDAASEDAALINGLAEAVHGLTDVPPIVTELLRAEVSGRWCIFVDNVKTPILPRLNKDEFEAIQGHLAKARGALWVVRHTTDNPRSLDANMAIGLARTVRSETSSHFATLDLGAVENMCDSEAVSHIQKVFSGVSKRKSQLLQRDLEFVVREGLVCVSRLVEHHSLNSSIQDQTQHASPQLQRFQQADRPLRLTTGHSRMLDELYFTDDRSCNNSLPEDHIQIQVHCVGLNFKDVLLAMGQVPGDLLGRECSGIVTGVGTAVTEFKLGDCVCAFVPGCISTIARGPATGAWAIPEGVSFEVAASVPGVLCTAYYSLIDLAHLSEGESVLIHGAAGGVGTAAIIIAQSIGARVFATVGSEKKRKFLMETFHIKEEHIFYSRDTSFAQGIQQATGGQGVDVALNSLAGDSLRETFACIAPFGRFIELGKRDIGQNSRLEMGPFDKNVTFASVDLDLLGEKQPKRLKRLLHDSIGLFVRTNSQPIWPVTTLSVSEIESGFRTLQASQVIGKLVLRMMDEDAMVKVRPARKPAELLKPGASYAVVGGTGGIGFDIASWLPQEGAKHLILVSRSGVKDEQTLQIIKDLSRNGVTIEICRCDVSDMHSVEQNLVPLLQRMPPVRGVVYGALVLRDTLFERMAYEDYCAVMKPRVDGIWNMEQMLRSLNMASSLDFFINLSSAATFVGNRGQAPYAAGGALSAALARYPEAFQLPYTTIDLPVVEGIGYLIDPEKRSRIVSQMGTDAIGSIEIRYLVTAAMRNEIREISEGHCVAGFADMKTIPIQRLPWWAQDPKLSVLACLSRLAEAGAADPSQATEISAASAVRLAGSPEAAEAIIVKAVLQKLSSILMRPAEELDPSAPIHAYGLDSLVAIEVRNWITRELEANLQILEILASDSTPALAQLIMQKSNIMSTKAQAKEANGVVNQETADAPSRANGLELF